MTTEAIHQNRGLIDGLRELADFLEANPQPLSYATVPLDVFVKTKEELAAMLKSGILGRVEKKADDNYFFLRRHFGDQVRLDFNVKRDVVCERIVTTKVVPAKPETVIPATPERVLPAVPEMTEEIVTWKCPESLLADDEKAEREQLAADEAVAESLIGEPATATTDVF